MTIYHALKQAALRLLPERLLLSFKKIQKIHYARVLGGNSADEPEFKALAHLVRQGDIVMDLGANIGSYTKFLSILVGTAGSCYSIEPIPPTYEILRSNIERHHLANVHPIAAAVSDEVGIVEMEVPQYPSGGRTFYEAGIVSRWAESRGRRFTIPATTVDAICSGPVHFIKCDVEDTRMQ
jgi:FkbM family methyltransferase